MSEDIVESNPERLTNSEFVELIPHLRLYDMFLIQIHIKSLWKGLFSVNYKSKMFNNIVCNICDEKITFGVFIDHLKSDTHKNALKKVDQFFHPVYTYAKNSGKLAKGEEKCSEKELKGGIQAAVAELERTSESKFLKAQEVANYIESLKFEDTISDLILNTDAKSPENIFAIVTLPIKDLMTIEFSIKDDEWKPMLTSKNPQSNGKFFCAICSKKCSGILTVNDHLNGYTHKSAQLETLGMRTKLYEHLTKNCCYRYDDKYSFTVTDAGKDLFREKVLEIIRKEGVNGVYKNFALDGEQRKEDDKRAIDISALPASIATKVEALSALVPKGAVADNANYENVDNEGLIGVEYVVKLMKTVGSVPSYECCLCEIILNEERMHSHLIGYNHRMKYCELHYPDTVKKFKHDIGQLKYCHYFYTMGHIMGKLAMAIEKYHGRGIPYQIAEEKFAKDRRNIIAEMHSLKHACQQYGPSFSNVVTPEEIEKFKEEVYKPPFIPPNYNPRFVKPTDKFYLNQKKYFPKNLGSNGVPPLPRSKSPNIRSDRYESKERRRRSPAAERHSGRTSDYGGEGSHRRDVRNSREEKTKSASEMEAAYEEYRKRPESHPLYEQEWNFFWKRRKEELISQGIDHRSYNYQPEWVAYFRQRLEFFFDEDIMKSKMSVRKKLNIDFDEDEDRHRRQLAFVETRPPFVEPMPLEMESFEPPKKRQFLNIDHYSDGSNNKDQFPMEPLAAVKPVLKDNKSNIIHALRLLTALEDHLGSLGSKIMDLLSLALVLEKKFSNNKLEFERQILTSENCTLLETAMEKLKGIIYAGLLDVHKLSGFNNVIQNTTDLLKYADKMGWRNARNPKIMNNLQDIVKSVHNQTEQKSLSDTLMNLISQQNRPMAQQLAPGKNDMGNFSGGNSMLPNQSLQPSFNKYNRSSFMDPKGNNNNNPNMQQNYQMSGVPMDMMSNSSRNLNKNSFQGEKMGNQPPVGVRGQMFNNNNNNNYNQNGNRGNLNNRPGNFNSYNVAKNLNYQQHSFGGQNSKMYSIDQPFMQQFNNNNRNN